MLILLTKRKIVLLEGRMTLLDAVNLYEVSQRKLVLFLSFLKFTFLVQPSCVGFYLKQLVCQRVELLFKVEIWLSTALYPGHSSQALEWVGGLRLSIASMRAGVPAVSFGLEYLLHAGNFDHAL